MKNFLIRTVLCSLVFSSASASGAELVSWTGAAMLLSLITVLVYAGITENYEGYRAGYLAGLHDSEPLQRKEIDIEA